AAVAASGRSFSRGDPSLDAGIALVLAASYDRGALRDSRAQAFDDRRPWCFCVHAGDRDMVAAAAAAREGWTLLLPADDRETRKTLADMTEAAKEIVAAASAGLLRLESSYSWKTSELDITRAGRRLARLIALAGFAPGRAEEDGCALALEEALLNAVEHGNLELDSSLKSADLLVEDLFEAEKARRLNDPSFGGRLVRLSLRADGEEARIVLEDEGRGFDASGIASAPIEARITGKGYWLMRRFFDSADYNAKGNAVTLVKRKASSPPR
ncbi:MAG: ATP-binding protein, partial [Spirochaetaceae bacterium]|nr:ATP-binding protein [Spirochaetaceae bacterium]